MKNKKAQVSLEAMKKTKFTKKVLAKKILGNIKLTNPTKILGINTTTIAGSATSEGAVQVRGNIAIEEGLLTLDSNINTSVSVPSGKNALLIGPTTVGAGATIDVAQGSTLVVV